MNNTVLSFAQNPFRSWFCTIWGESKAVSQLKAKSPTGLWTQAGISNNNTFPTYLEGLHNTRRQRTKQVRTCSEKVPQAWVFLIKSQYETTRLGFMLRGNCKKWQKEVCVCVCMYVGGCCFMTHVMHPTAIPSLHWTLRAFGGVIIYNNFITFTSLDCMTRISVDARAVKKLTGL